MTSSPPLGAGGMGEVYRARAVALKVLPQTFVADAGPFWSRKGDRLFFNTSAATSAVVDVKTTATVTFSSPAPFPRAGRTEPNPATSRRNIDALPDGRVLGITTAGDGRLDTGGAMQFNVVLNWLPQVTAKLAH